MTRYSSTMRDALMQIREGYSQVKEAPEDNMPASPDEGSMAVQQLEFMMHAIQKMKMHIQSGGEFPEWMQNKLSGTHEKLKGLYANIEHGDMNEEAALDEKKTVTKTFGVEFEIDAPEEKPIRTGKEPHVKLVNKLVKKYKLFDVHADDLSKFNVKDDVGGRNVQKFFKELSKSYEVIRKKITDNYTSTEFDFSEESFDLDELKMDDPKLNKVFDKLKRGDTVKLKTSSTISQGKDFVDYVVKSKNVVNKGRVEKITLVTKGNEKAVKKFLYKRDGKVTFAIGDMGASIDDIKEGTWALPDSPKAKAELKKLMSKPIKLGKEGDEASDKLYALIGDDELFDDLYVAGKKNPNGDARDVVKKHMKRLGIKEEVELEEGKSSTGYELYHKDFSSAMKHAYDFAKKKFGIEVDPKEIDDKVASGPRKPSKGKTNSYRLKGKDGKKAIQVQVYGMDNGKYELNMYKEGVEPIQWPSQPLEEKLKVSDGLGAWIDDFKKSDAPQFQGKSDEEKKNMAIAAFTDAGGKLDEMREPYAVVDTADGDKVVGTASDEKGAKSIISTSQLPPMKIKDKKTLKIVKVKKKQMIGQPIKEETLEEAPKMKYALVGKDMKIYSMGSDERDLKLDRRSLEKRFKDVAPLKLARLKTAQSIGDKVDKSQLKEEEEPNKPDSAKAVDQMRDDKKKTRIAQLQLQIAKAQETINKINAQEKPNG